MQGCWNDFVGMLSESERRALFDDMRLDVGGFRKGSKSIPPGMINSALESAFTRRGGRSFLTWFRRKFKTLLQTLDDSSDEELDKYRDEWIKNYPPQILQIAFSLAKPELIDAWKTDLEESRKALDAEQDQDSEGAFAQELEELKKSLAERKQQLDELQRKVDSLESEDRKLQRQNRRLKQQLDQQEQVAKRKAAEHKREKQQWKQRYEDKVDELAALSHRLNEAHEDAAQQKEMLQRLQLNESKYKNYVLEQQTLLNLYRSLAGSVSSENDHAKGRIIIFGSEFPAQTFDIQGQTLRFEGVADSKLLDNPEGYESYDHIFLLSSCQHRVRLKAYQHFGAKMTEIASLSDLRSELRLKEGSS